MAETKTASRRARGRIARPLHAEKQFVRGAKEARAAGRDELREALENHLDETEHQLTRLEQVFEQLEERPRAKPCAGMAGIIEEGSELLKEDFPEAAMDAQIITAAQRVEHYEMAAYGTVAAWADQLGRGEVAPATAGHGRATAAEQPAGRRRRPGVKLRLGRPNAVAAERISKMVLAACHG
jgi:ferritin-like metal-binding protein YciE